MGERVLTFFKILCIAYLVFFVPRIITMYNDTDMHATLTQAGSKRPAQLHAQSKRLKFIHFDGWPFEPGKTLLSAGFEHLFIDSPVGDVHPSFTMHALYQRLHVPLYHDVTSQALAVFYKKFHTSPRV